MKDENYFSTAGQYRIEVQGHFPLDRSDRFGSLQVLLSPPAGNRGVTVLQGPVSDQAELAGILTNLHEFHLSLLSIQCLKGG